MQTFTPLNPEYLVTITVIITALALTLWYWLRKSASRQKHLGWIALCTAWWGTFYLLELLIPGIEGKLLMENMQFSVLFLLPVIVLFFTFHFVNLPIKRSLKSLFWIEPVVMLLILWADSSLRWFRLGESIQGNVSMSTTLISIHGWAYWVSGSYSILLLVVSIILVIRELVRTPFWQRIRTGFVLIAEVTALAGVLAVMPGELSSRSTYLMLAGSILSQLILLAGASQRQTLALIPIARETVLEQMQDPVIVVNLKGEIAAANMAAGHLPGFETGKTTGQKISAISPEWHALKTSSETSEQYQQDLKFETPAGTRYYDAVISPVKDNRQSIVGSLVVLHETTRQIRTQNELAVLRHLSEDFNQATEIRAAVEPAMKTVSELSACQYALIRLSDGAGTLDKAFSYDPEKGEDGFSEVKGEIHSGDCAAALNAGELTSPREFEPCDCTANVPEADTENGRNLAIPLMVSGNSLGILNLFYRDGSPMPDDSRLHLIHTVCNSLSVTLERIRLFELEHDQRQQAEKMQNVGQIITSSLDFNEVLDKLLEQLEQLVPYDAANIMWIDGPVARISRSRGYERYVPGIQEEFARLEFPVQTTDNVRKLLSGQSTLLIPDIATSPTWQHTHLNLQFHSWLGAPVVIQGTVVAIFSLEREQVNAFSRSDADRLSAFAVLAGLSIQNSQLYEAERQRIRELEGLQATLTDISGELEQDQLLQKIVRRAINLLHASVAQLALYDKATDALQIVVALNFDRDTVGQKFQMGEGLMGEVAQSRQPKAVQYYDNWSVMRDGAVTDTYAGLAVPMLAGNELLGVLGVGGLPPNREYTEEEIRLLNLFAQQATVAIHNARLYENARRQAAESETLQRASSVVISTLDLDQSLDRILEQLATVVPFNSASVLLLRNDQLQIVGGHGFEDNHRVLGARLTLDRSNPGAEVFLNTKPLIINDVPAKHPDFGILSGTDIQSWLGVPLRFQDRTIGILALDSAAPNAFSEDQARLIQAFADQVSVALENISLYEKALKAANRFEILYRLTQEINANLSQDQVCSAIHRAASSLMLTECFMISLLDEANREIFDIYMVDRGAPIPLERRPASQGLFARVIADGKSRRYDTFSQNEIANTGAILLGEEDDDSVTQSLLVVPLQLGSKIKGVISVQSYLSNQYTQEDMEMLELLAGQGAIALENSRLFGEVQQLAITDPLTQLFNRRRFFDLADQEFGRSQRYGRPLSVIMLDIDHFKRVNDTYGHYVGDQVLQQLAAICSKNIRAIDILARYGGEEFVIMTPETTADEAVATCERLRHAVSMESFTTTRGPIPVSISLGVVDLSQPCKTLEELLDRSDQALYHSKETGRNRTSVWTETDTMPKHPDASHLMN